jgi:hypothetical protein
VIPACAVGCGGQSSTTSNVKDGSSSSDSPFLGVAAVGYCAFCDGGYLTVAAIGFDAAVDTGTSEAATGVDSVAFIGFDAGLDSGDQG